MKDQTKLKKGCVICYLNGGAVRIGVVVEVDGPMSYVFINHTGQISHFFTERVPGSIYDITIF